VKKKGSLLGGADAVERKAVSACGLMDLGVILHRRRYLEKCRHRRKENLGDDPFMGGFGM